MEQSRKVFAVASGGGHWNQLMLIKEAFPEEHTTYITTIDGLPQDFGLTRFLIINDCNKNQKFKIVLVMLKLLKLFIFNKPNVVVSTGAAPGVIAILLGKIFKAKTIWIDSIANAEQLSMGGQICRKFADITLTQWEELSCRDIEFKGSVF